MYNIIGSDQKEYGPVSAAQIHQWFADGRLHRAMPARPASEKEWKTLGALPEFANLFPPPPGLTSSTPVTTENCGLATAALICGALGLVVAMNAYEKMFSLSPAAATSTTAPIGPQTLT